MTEEKKVITIDDVEYTEDELNDTAKMCINHINSLEQKIGRRLLRYSAATASLQAH